MADTHAELKHISQLNRQAADKKFEAHSKETLKIHVKKKFKTTMIGSLSRFEDIFGHLWGHGKDQGDLTEQELQFREMWDLTRTEVLNNGNNQARAAELEIDNYTVRYQKNQYEFKLQDKKELTTDE